MIHDVDRALTLLMKEANNAPENLDVQFEAPIKAWADALDPERPTIDFCLYDVREDTTLHRAGSRPIRNERNKIIGHAPQPRFYKLSYIVTAWLGETEKMHELTGWVLTTLSGMEFLPGHVLTGKLLNIQSQVRSVVAQPAQENRPTPQSLTALSGEVHPTLDLVLTIPVEFEPAPAAGLVLEPLILDAAVENQRGMERVQRSPQRAGMRELERLPAGRPLIERSRAALEAGDGAAAE